MASKHANRNALIGNSWVKTPGAFLKLQSYPHVRVQRGHFVSTFVATTLLYTLLKTRKLSKTTTSKERLSLSIRESSFILARLFTGLFSPALFTISVLTSVFESSISLFTTQTTTSVVNRVVGFQSALRK